MLSIVAYYAGRLVLAYLGVTMLLGSIIGVRQEAKIWAAAPGLPALSLWGRTKVFFFNLLWFTLCLLGSIAVCVKWVLTLGTSDVARDANRLVEHGAAVAVIRCFVGTVRVRGAEHLPEDAAMTPAPVYVCNHASQMDAASVYFLGRRFLWVAKASVLFLPGVGAVMYLGGHVLLQRSGRDHRRSVAQLYERATAAVRRGLPVFFFPQGTRWQAERLPFKDGAFVVAQATRSPLVPLSLELPPEGWNSGYPLSRLWGGAVPEVRLTVHPPIPVTGTEDREALKRRCVDAIYSVLPPPPPAAAGDKKGS